VSVCHEPVGGARTRFSLMAGLSPPRTSFWEAVVNSTRPAMGRYSWLRSGSLRRISSACSEALSARCFLAWKVGEWKSSSNGWTHLLDHGQDPWLRIVVPVSSNAQVDLLGVLVAAISSHQPEQRVFWRLGDDARVESGSSHWCDVGGYLGESGL
jgi:hypothetical protein